MTDTKTQKNVFFFFEIVKTKLKSISEFPEESSFVLKNNKPKNKIINFKIKYFLCNITADNSG